VSSQLRAQVQDQQLQLKRLQADLTTARAQAAAGGHAGEPAGPVAPTSRSSADDAGYTLQPRLSTSHEPRGAQREQVEFVSTALAEK
jgi:hypothetical protein